MVTNDKARKTRIAVYIRTGGSQLCITQKDHYEGFISRNPNWELAEFYVDIGANKDLHPELSRLLFDCKAEKIDLIITKNIARLSKNLVSAIHIARELSELKNPVGIYFEQENLNTLEAHNLLLFKLTEDTAKAESRNKNKRMPFSIYNKGADK